MENTINDRVIALLKELNINEQELASLIGKSPSTIYRIVKKEVEPSKTTVKLIADATKKSFDYLYKGSGSASDSMQVVAKADSGPWKDEAYSNVKAQLEYLQKKYDQLFDAVINGKLGKLLALELAGEYKLSA